MKKYNLLLPLFLLLSPSWFDAMQVTEIEKLSNEWMIACQKKDKTTLEKYTSPDFTLTSKNGDAAVGEPVTREVWMTNSLEHLNIQTFRYSNVRVQASADKATMWSDFYWEVSFDQSPVMKDSVRLVDTWVRKGSGWQVLNRTLLEK